MNLKFFRKKKKTLVDPRQKKTNYLFSQEESIRYGSTGRGSLEIPEEQGITLNHHLDTNNLATKILCATNAKSHVTTKVTA